ncbi:hypothetical protein H8E52_07265 [bacterium]|nr:hypothetical protein [bacterium]
MPLRKLSPDAKLFPALVLLALALYAPILGVFFSLDDFEFLLRASGQEPWPDGIRRILSTRLFFSAAWGLFAERAELYHLTQLLLHLASSWMIILIARRLKLVAMAGVTAAALFLVTPVAFTSLHWISGIQELSMAYFALLAAWLALGKGLKSAVLSLIAFAAALLCKESAALLLPAMAMLLPGDRLRRLLLGAGGLVMAAILLTLVGAFTPKFSGDPYETGYGMNLLWNLLSYLAWLARPWDYFPDRVPQFQKSLAPWGLVLPAAALFAYLKFKSARASILKVAAIFLLLLLPVLPLLRHSYLYYLYLPLVPLWLLLGEGLSRASVARKWILLVSVSLIALGSSWLASERRHAELGGGLLEDPMIRYAQLAENAVESATESESAPEGDMLILVPFLGESQTLGDRLRDLEGGQKVQFLPVDRALLAGRALRLFFPKVNHVEFAYEVPTDDKWRSQHIWWTFGQGQLGVLGFGEQGRHALARLLFEKGEPTRAAHEIQALLNLHPDDANLLYDLGRLELAAQNSEKAFEILKRLETMASHESADDNLKRAHLDLQKLYQTHLGKAP